MLCQNCSAVQQTLTVKRFETKNLFRSHPVRAGVFQQRVVVGRFDRREVAVRDPFRPRELGDVVGDRAQRQVDDLARVGRDVGRRGVHQIAVEHQHRAGLAGGRHDADPVGAGGFRGEPRHRLLVERPQRIRCGELVVAGGEYALLVTFRNQQQRAVDRHHLVEEYRDVHGAWLRHAVVALPGAVILVPLPDVAFEGDVWQWHQDYGTWQRDDGMPQPRAMNIAVFLDEVMPINGPLLLIPKSHKQGVFAAGHDKLTTSYPLWTLCLLYTSPS